MKHNRRHQLAQKATGKSQPEGDVSVESMIKELKSEILAEIRLISTGVSNSLYKLVELDKELAELEKELETKSEA